MAWFVPIPKPLDTDSVWCKLTEKYKNKNGRGEEVPSVNQKFQRTPRRLKLGRINLNRKQKKKIRVNNISFEGKPKEDLN